MKAGLIGGYGMGRWRPSQVAAGQGGKSGHGRQFRVSAGGTRKAYGPLDYPHLVVLLLLFLFLIHMASPRLSKISNSKTKDLSSSLGF